MPPVRRAAQILGQRVLLGAQRLVHLVAAIGDGNSFKDFPGKKASLRRCQTRGDDDSVNAQPTRCRRIGRRFGLNQNIAQHGFPQRYGVHFGGAKVPSNALTASPRSKLRHSFCDYAAAPMCRLLTCL
jgi:hypothetical protein